MISGGNVCVCDPGVSMVQKAPAKAAVLLRDGLDYAFCGARAVGFNYGR